MARIRAKEVEAEAEPETAEAKPETTEAEEAEAEPEAASRQWVADEVSDKGRYLADVSDRRRPRGGPRIQEIACLDREAHASADAHLRAETVQVASRNEPPAG